MLSETRYPQCEKLPSPSRTCALFAVCLALLTACSSESLPPPEPEVQHAGAFFAVGATDLELYRTLKAVRISGDTILFTTLYDEVPASFDHARAIARQASIPIREPLAVRSKAVLVGLRHQVVWFRTLTEEEEDRAP